jgi:sugar lactone lactonase YvrE
VNRIRKVDTSGTITTFAGNGDGGPYIDGLPATETAIAAPEFLTLAPNGDIYCSTISHVLRINSTSGLVSAVAGITSGPFPVDGQENVATETNIAPPGGLLVDSDGTVYFTRVNFGEIWKVDPASGLLEKVASGLSFPRGLVRDRNGDFLVVDSDNHRVRRINSSGRAVTFAGTGSESTEIEDGTPALQAPLSGAWDIEIDALGDVFISLFSGIVKVDTSGTIYRLAESGLVCPRGIALDAEGDVYFAERDRRVGKISAPPGGFGSGLLLLVSVDQNLFIVAASGTPDTIQVEIRLVDKNGNTIIDSSTEVELDSRFQETLNGANIGTPTNIKDTATVINGIATFTRTSSATGFFTLTATALGVTGEPIVIEVLAVNSRLELTADRTSIAPG